MPAVNSSNGFFVCVCAHITIQDDSEQNSHIHKNGLTSLTQHLHAQSCFESAPLTDLGRLKINVIKGMFSNV